MNCHVVELKGKCKRYVASTAEARAMRDAIMQGYSVKKKEVTMQPCQILTSKEDLLVFLNNVMVLLDKEEV